VIGGVQLRRPTARSAKYEPEQNERVLASGATRTYYAGRRLLVTLAFAKLSEEEKDALSAVLAAPYVTYQDDALSDPVVMGISDAPNFEAIGGTFPLRFNTSVSLKARDLVP
jgi:hypothetical protein